MDKLCKKCKTHKPQSEFYKADEYNDGFQYWCKDCCRINHSEFSFNNRQDWVMYFNSKNILPKCEICGKDLKFFNGRFGVNFDHKKVNLPIQFSPSVWLGTHRVSEKNIKIWESCKFGILCSDCNNFLPTNEREQKTKGLVKYVFGKSLDSEL